MRCQEIEDINLQGRGTLQHLPEDQPARSVHREAFVVALYHRAVAAIPQESAFHGSRHAVDAEAHDEEIISLGQDLKEGIIGRMGITGTDLGRPGDPGMLENEELANRPDPRGVPLNRFDDGRSQLGKTAQVALEGIARSAAPASKRTGGRTEVCERRAVLSGDTNVASGRDEGRDYGIVSDAGQPDGVDVVHAPDRVPGEFEPLRLLGTLFDKSITILGRRITEALQNAERP